MERTDFKDALKKIFSKDLDSFFEEANKTIFQTSQQSNLLLSLKGRYNDVRTEKIKGTLSNEEYDLRINKLRADLFDFVDGLESSTYIPDLDLSEMRSKFSQLNSNVILALERVAELEGQVRSASSKIYQLEKQLDLQHLKLLERSILSINTQDANLESYHMDSYLRICAKYGSSTLKYQVDTIIDAVLKYSEKYPDLPDNEKDMLVTSLGNVDLKMVTKKKYDQILKNFGLGG